MRREGMMREAEAPFLKQVRQTMRRSEDLVERARLRLDETDRLLAKRGLSREGRNADAGGGEAKCEVASRVFSSGGEADSVAVQRHRVRQLRRLLKVARV